MDHQRVARVLGLCWHFSFQAAFGPLKTRGQPNEKGPWATLKILTLRIGSEAPWPLYIVLVFVGIRFVFATPRPGLIRVSVRPTKAVRITS